MDYFKSENFYLAKTMSDKLQQTNSSNQTTNNDENKKDEVSIY